MLMSKIKIAWTAIDIFLTVVVLAWAVKTWSVNSEPVKPFEIIVLVLLLDIARTKRFG
jgi:hypothetical protein